MQLIYYLEETRHSST